MNSLVRTQELLEARQLASTHSESYANSWGCADKVKELAKAYREKVNSRGILLRSISDPNDFVLVASKTRFDKNYYDGLVKKIKSLPDFNHGVFLTLTLDPKNFNSLADAYKNLQHGFNRLLTMLKARARKNNLKLNYIKVVEFQDNGSPHLHIIFTNIWYLMDFKELQEFWQNKYGLGTFVNLKHVYRDHRQVIAYILWYLKKSYTESSLTWLSLCWAVGSRSFSVSACFFKYWANFSKSKRYIFFGSGDFQELKAWLTASIVPDGYKCPIKQLALGDSFEKK